MRAWIWDHTGPPAQGGQHMIRALVTLAVLLYLGLVATISHAAVWSRDADQRRDARLTLRLLLMAGGGLGGVSSIAATTWKFHELGLL